MFVHPVNNPANLTYNTSVLMFLRSWYMPFSETGCPNADNWVIVPAIASPLPDTGVDANAQAARTYVYPNPNIQLIATAIIDPETGYVTRMARSKANVKIDLRIVDWIKFEALSIPDYEEAKDKPWPYASMFEIPKIRERFHAKYGSSNTLYDAPIISGTFEKVRKLVATPPCNCKNKGAQYSG